MRRNGRRRLVLQVQGVFEFSISPVLCSLSVGSIRASSRATEVVGRIRESGKRRRHLMGVATSATQTVAPLEVGVTFRWLVLR